MGTCLPGAGSTCSVHHLQGTSWVPGQISSGTSPSAWRWSQGLSALRRPRVSPHWQMWWDSWIQTALRRGMGPVPLSPPWALPHVPNSLAQPSS